MMKFMKYVKKGISFYIKRREFTTHSSVTAKGFFEKRGYKVVKEQQVSDIIKAVAG